MNTEPHFYSRWRGALQRMPLSPAPTRLPGEAAATGADTHRRRWCGRELAASPRTHACADGHNVPNPNITGA